MTYGINYCDYFSRHFAHSDMARFVSLKGLAQRSIDETFIFKHLNRDAENNPMFLSI
jgi:hypothetical protein